MLTYPSDSLTKIVCPMDEDAIPPNPVCSAPPHSEPPPPLLPFSYITPSQAKDGLSGSRRSDRIQGIRGQTPKKQSYTDIQTQKPSRPNPSPTKRQRESMVQVSQSKQPRSEGTRAHQKPLKGEIDITFTENQNGRKDPQRKNYISLDKTMIEPLEEKTAPSLDVTLPDMDTCEELPAENISASKGWVIGPLFQSLKSKMASFTEIVMTPVKLFRASSPLPSRDLLDKLDDCDLQADGATEVTHPDPDDVDRNQDTKIDQQTDAQSTETFVPKCSKKLKFDVPSEQTVDCILMPLQDGPLACTDSQHASGSFESTPSSSTLLRVSARSSASHESKLKTSIAVEVKKGKISARKPSRNSSVSKSANAIKQPVYPELMDRKLSLCNLVKLNKIDFLAPPLSSSVCYAQPDGSEAFHVENCLVRQSLRHHLSNGADQAAPRSAVESQMTPRTCSEPSYEDSKRDSVKRKRALDEIKPQQVSNAASDYDVTRGPRTPRRAAALISAIASEEIIRSGEKRQSASARANRKGRSGQEMLAVNNKAIIINQAERSSDVRLVCSQDGSSSRVKPGGSSKRLKTRAALKHDGAMDLETTLAVTSTKRGAEEPLSELLLHTDIKHLQDANENPLKRKSLNHVSSMTGKEPTSSVELMSAGLTSQPLQETDSLDRRARRASRRPKNGPSTETQHDSSLHLITKDSQSQNWKRKVSVDPLYFEMTPFECTQPTQHSVDPDMQLNEEEKCVIEEREKISASVTDEVFPTDSEMSINRSRSNRKREKVKRRRADSQRRRCRVLHTRTRKGEDVRKSATMEDADLAASCSSSSRCLLRSYSCPEIPFLCPHDSPWTSSPHPVQHSRSHQHQHHHSPLGAHAHRSLRRARRHTVCSVEVERELAPLCLRKEVYPSRRSAPYDPVSHHPTGGHAHSPSTTLSALASCFLSSPLAFLSKKVDLRGAATSPNTSSHPPASSMCSGSSSTWHSPAFNPKVDSAEILDSSRNPLQCNAERRRQSDEDDGEDMSSSSHEFEDVGLREEKALSDSEIKVVQKHEEQRKVSSIRIRKTLPKPQTNLTPMGLPKPIRLKKKEFSLEEIYTNKNFSKPPESRLETIFEVPLNRRNGSETRFGQRRVKRFLEFLEVGEARKPKKALVGVGKVGVSSCRTRRGTFSKDGPSLSAQDVDSLLCSKLDQLNLWLMDDQKDR